jgi:hypothetical protein
MKVSIVVASLELCVASALTFFAGVAAWSAFGPHDDRWGHLDAWSSLALFLLLPLAVAFWICAAALFWKWRYRWSLHALPSAIVIGEWWWLGYAV